jgi:hypothetical protein
MITVEIDLGEYERRPMTKANQITRAAWVSRKLVPMGIPVYPWFGGTTTFGRLTVRGPGELIEEALPNNVIRYTWIPGEAKPEPAYELEPHVYPDEVTDKARQSRINETIDRMAQMIGQPRRAS